MAQLIDSVTKVSAPECSGTREDREDYQRFLIEYGFTHEAVAALSENQTDQIPMPCGFDAIELRDSPIQGKGLFATRTVQTGELLAPVRIVGRRAPAGRFTNHSTRPNARFLRTDDDPDGDIYMVACRPMSKGEEVLLDYRQAGSANGWGCRPDPFLAMETVRLRLGGQDASHNVSDKDLGQCMAGVLTALRYIPTEFTQLVLEGALQRIAAESGYLQAGLYLGRRFS